MKKSDEVKRKFIESIKANGFQVKTDTGWSDIKHLHKTIKYDIWILKTERHELKCADTHIVFYSNINNEILDEVYVCELNPGDIISTEDGHDVVLSVTKSSSSANMYDLELDDENHRFYTNGILSHNSTCTRAYLLWFALFNKSKQIAILANKEDLAIEQLELLKSSYIDLPIWMQMGVRVWNTKNILLGNGSRIIARATSKDAIRGRTVHKLYCDEFAFVPDNIAEAFIRSVFPTISSSKNRNLLITSCVTKDTYVFTNKGIQQIGDYVDDDKGYGGGYYIPEYKVQGMRGELNTGIIMHNDGLKETRIIASQYGELEGSLEHKYWASKNGNQNWYRARDLEIGDLISHRIGSECWGSDDIVEYTPIPSTKPNENYFNIDTIAEDHAYFFGLYVASGIMSIFEAAGTTRHKLTIRTEYDLSSVFNSLSLRASYTKNIKKYCIYSKSLVNTMMKLDFPISKTCRKNRITIPKRLLRMSRSNMISMLRGIYDIAGTVDIDTNSINLSFQSRELINQVRVILNNLGILSEYHSHVVLSAMRPALRPTIHTLRITDNHSIETYLDKVGFAISSKQTQLHSIRSRGKDIDITGNLILSPVTSIKHSQSEVYDFSLNDVDGDAWCHSVIYNGILGEQTPQGMNHFYRLWLKAENGKGSFKTIHINWNEVPGRTEEWAQEQIDDIGEIAFNQEFKCDFLGSDSTVINSDYLTKLIKISSTVDPLPIKGLDPRESGIRIYQKPLDKSILDQNEWSYVASLDTSMGMKEDSTVLQICLVKSNRNIWQVATMSKNNLNVREFCDKAMPLLKAYHNPDLIIEANGPGENAITIFNNIYMYENMVNFDHRRKRLGLVPTNPAKYKAVVLLKAYLEKNLLKVFDDATINELSSFGKVGEKKFKGKNGSHDDHVTSLYWIPYFVNSPMYWGKIDQEELNNFTSLLELPNDKSVIGNTLDEEAVRILARSGDYSRNYYEDDIDIEVSGENMVDGYNMEEEDSDPGHLTDYWGRPLKK